MLLVSTNTISFTRLPYNICSKYKIFVKENVNGEIKEYLLDTLDNLKTSAPVKERKTLKYNVYKEWQLPEDTTDSASQDMKVCLNNIEIESTKYTYSSSFKTLKVHCEIKENDLIEAEYLVDRIVYEHVTPNQCEYKIVPIYRNSHMLGQHTII